MDKNKLFTPDIEKTQEYGRKITDLFYKLGYTSNEKIAGMTHSLVIGNIPYSLRSLGIPSGTVELVPNNIPHMIGFGQEKTTASYKNMHNLTLQELLEIPNMISDPDMVFRSNSSPNSSIIVCKEVERRGNPIVLAMKIQIQSTLDAGGIIVSGYEKDSSPKEFFSNLYEYGYCIYDREQSEFFNSIKLGTGVRDRLPGPIPASAVTCTVPGDMTSISPEGISPSDIQRILTKTDIVNKYEENANQVVAIMQEDSKLAELYDRNLSELGFHTIRLKVLTGSEILSVAKHSDAIVCGKGNIARFTALKDKFPTIKKIGQIEDFLPSPIFSTEMPPLSEIRNKNHINRRRI